MWTGELAPTHVLSKQIAVRGTYRVHARFVCGPPAGFIISRYSDGCTVSTSPKSLAVTIERSCRVRVNYSIQQQLHTQGTESQEEDMCSLRKAASFQPSVLQH